MRVRPMRSGDTADVRRVFRDTLALGRPLPFRAVALDRYEALCLDWYLDPARLVDHAVLVDDGGQVRGYALVCGDQAAFTRWSRAAGLRWASATVGALIARRFGPDEARFHRLRLVDGWSAVRARIDPGLPAHAHVNLAGGARGRMHMVALVDHIDMRCDAKGLPGWFDEINAPAGRRAGALETHGAAVVHRMPMEICRRAADGLPVTFLGFLHDRARLAELLASADVALAPGPMETFGLAALEALACGTPVVGRRSGALPELLDGGAGVVAYGHPSAFADAVCRILASAEGQRRGAARARAERFGWQRTVDGMLRAHRLAVRSAA